MVSKAWNCTKGANLSVELEKFEDHTPDIIRIRLGPDTAAEFRVSSPEKLAQLRALGPILIEACSYASVTNGAVRIPLTVKKSSKKKRRR